MLTDYVEPWLTPQPMMTMLVDRPYFICRSSSSMKSKSADILILSKIDPVSTIVNAISNRHMGGRRKGSIRYSVRFLN